jgi:hypothetical protein
VPCKIQRSLSFAAEWGLRFFAVAVFCAAAWRVCSLYSATDEVRFVKRLPGALYGLSWRDSSFTVAIRVPSVESVQSGDADLYASLARLCVRVSRVLIAVPVDSRGRNPEAVIASMLRFRRNVRLVSSEAVRARDTPLLVLVDQQGKIVRFWKGPFSEADRTEIRSAVRRRMIDAVLNTAPSAAAFAAMLQQKTPVMVIDGRSRLEFQRRHIRGAVNIPFDEFPVRLRVEVAPEQAVIYYCGESDVPRLLWNCAAHAGAGVLPGALVLGESFEALEKVGVPLEPRERL